MVPASAPMRVSVMSLPTIAAAARSEETQAPRLARDHSQLNTTTMDKEDDGDADTDASSSDEDSSSSSSSCSSFDLDALDSDDDETPLSSIRDDRRSSLSSATHSSPSSPTVSVESARAFVQLDHEFGYLFSPEESSWVCHHSCARDCRTDSFAGRTSATIHNTGIASHPHCDAHCSMHRYLTLRHRAYLPEAEARARAVGGWSASASHRICVAGGISGLHKLDCK